MITFERRVLMLYRCGTNMPVGAALASLARFLAVGAINTLVGLGTIWITKNVVGLGNVAANLSGYSVGLTVSFLLNRRWTFLFQGKQALAFLRFLSVFCISYAANLMTVLVLIKVTGRDSFWFQALGTVPYTAIFYLGCRWYVFPVRVRSGRQASELM